MASSTPRGITYPTSGDKIKDGSSPSALAADFARTANSTDASITASIQESKEYTDGEIVAAMAGVSAVAFMASTLPDGPIPYDLDPGIHQQPLGSSTVTVGNKYPAGEDRGFLIQLTGEDGGKKGRLYFGLLTGNLWIQEKYGSTAQWGAWRQIGNKRPLADQLGTSPIPYDLAPGLWQQPLGADVVTEANGYPPGENRGFLQALSGTDGGKKGRLYIGLLTGQLWIQEKYGSSAAWGEWRKIGGNGGSSPAGHAMGVDGAHRKQELIRRKGGQIGTGGRGVIVLRFDHQNPDFQSKILPLLQNRGMPYTHAQYALALSATQEGGYGGDVQAGLTWSQVQEACLRQGGELASHSYTHADTTDYEREIFGSRSYLETQMPQMVAEVFVQPGIAGSAWDGMALNLSNPAQWRDFEAGRMIRDAYGLYTGSGALYWPLTGDASDGIPYTTLDTATNASAAINIINACAAQGYGAVLMMHPNRIDSTGGITTATLTQILDHLVAKRDAGEVMVLTMSGLSVASAHHSHRSQLLEGTDFDLSRWQNTTGWTTTAGVASTTTGGLIKRAWTPSAHSWALGGAREALCEFRAPQGAQIKVHMVDYTNPTKLDTTRTVNLPPSPDWVKVRQPFIIPKTTAGLHFEVGRVSGGQVDMRNPGMYAI